MLCDGTFVNHKHFRFNLSEIRVFFLIICFVWGIFLAMPMHVEVPGLGIKPVAKKWPEPLQ